MNFRSLHKSLDTLSLTPSIKLPQDIVDIITSSSDGFTNWDVYVSPFAASNFGLNEYLIGYLCRLMYLGSPGFEYAISASGVSDNLFP